MNQFDEKIDRQIESIKDEMFAVARFIHAHPEPPLEEYDSAAKLSEVLKQHGFSLTEKAGGLDTAFIATKDSGQPGPHVAFLCEYDALPGLGHACGHNLIAICGLAAGLALDKALPDLPGKISVYGTPAEESPVKSGKIKMLKAGCFEGVDMAFMAHPSNANRLGQSFLAANHIAFSFQGLPAHAAGSPHKGVNAYDAVQLTFAGLSYLRQQLRQDARVHWGEVHVPAAMNVIPEFASAVLGVRATDNEYTEELTEKAVNCIKGAALMTGCEADYTVTHGYEAIKINHTMLDLVAKGFEQAGLVPDPPNPFGQGGSTDLGNLSQKVPAVHPMYKVYEGPAPHTEEFCEISKTDEAMEISLKVGGALAKAAAAIMLDPDKMRQVKEEFEQK
jgi:amidohydrolase